MFVDCLLTILSVMWGFYIFPIYCLWKNYFLRSFSFLLEYTFCCFFFSLELAYFYIPSSEKMLELSVRLSVCTPSMFVTSATMTTNTSLQGSVSREDILAQFWCSFLFVLISCSFVLGVFVWLSSKFFCKWQK